ncbi:hypothetical protein Xhom_00299 [Xenorhabdus hominickii]|uniref:Uncharacterized protein n=1 Tax=Xenorhabdus hominickii TaxID=351679 RepID=A0A2G0Q7W4_XENHO|nr:hypothetical protein Xhom_02036 [Xenorhabdus hominickii]PHM57333.1 hypothetical protein Xhom_00299 [Xenorhabdus hominickii]
MFKFINVFDVIKLFFTGWYFKKIPFKIIRIDKFCGYKIKYTFD